jgi:hypothetical protein
MFIDSAKIYFRGVTGGTVLLHFVARSLCRVVDLLVGMADAAEM